MAERPVFLPKTEGAVLVETRMVEFVWAPGMAISQKQKSIAALHQAAREQLGVQALLEISTKSPDPLGVSLSAFNLAYRPEGARRAYPVEVLFQSAKVFAAGGPYRDIRNKSPADAKRDPRLKESGRLIRFESGGVEWGLEPPTAFYDWLYINVLRHQSDLAEQAHRFDGFTDIEFNPKKSISCQAYSLALFVALTARQLLTDALRSRDDFIEVVRSFNPGVTQDETSPNHAMF